jgi:dihydroorotate dehydrogenase
MSLFSTIAAASYPFVKPLLFSQDAEDAHHMTISGLKMAQRLGLCKTPPPEVNPITLWGLRFPNRVGLAAGMDKAGECVDGFGEMGFGFVEIGTLTPRPQPGNPKPRLFRIPEREAVLNRFGFNNPGITQGLINASPRRYQGVLGVNIGKNFDTLNSDALSDYLICLRAAWKQADYITVNLSSPNTKGLRDLQQEDSCRALIQALKEAAKPLQQTFQKDVPILIKIAPDVPSAQLEGMARLFVEEKLDGVIATNTTLSRRFVDHHPLHTQAGGLSGAPLTKLATEVIAALVKMLDGNLPVIGVGGIMTGPDAREKLEAGAQLVQLYSGLVYGGPALVRDCLEATAV